MRKLPAYSCYLSSLRFWKSEFKYLVPVLKSRSVRVLAEKGWWTRCHRHTDKFLCDFELVAFREDPSTLLFPLPTSMFRDLSPTLRACLVHPHSPYAGRTQYRTTLLSESGSSLCRQKGLCWHTQKLWLNRQEAGDSSSFWTVDASSLARLYIQALCPTARCALRALQTVLLCVLCWAPWWGRLFSPGEDLSMGRGF